LGTRSVIGFGLGFQFNTRFAARVSREPLGRTKVTSETNKMRSQVAALLCMLAVSNSSAQENKVLLRWKIAANKPAAFEYVQETISSNMNGRMQDFMSSLSGPKTKDTNVCLLTLLPNGNLSVKLVANPISDDTSDQKGFTQMMAGMQRDFGRVNLRGEIDASGAVTSFYMEQSQKNLLAMLCELPKDSVSIGDTWPLHANLVWVKGAFLADTAIRVSTVRLVRLGEESGDLCAELEYSLFENVSGYNGRRSDKTHMGISFKYTCTAEFNVTQGQWNSLEGFLEMGNKYHSYIRTKQRSSLRRIDNIPKDMLQIE